MSSRTMYDKITEIAKRRGFYWPSFEIYGGLSGFVTYGDLGSKLKRNIKRQWRKFFVSPQRFLELDAPLINPHIVFEASGHLENFKEYSVECAQCSRSFRADHIIEDKTGMENVEAMGEQTIKSLLVENDIKCPVCGGALQEPVMILTMFKTEIGTTDSDIGYARPEAAQSMFMNFKRGYLLAREKLPFALAQIGKVLRNEISPRRGMIRLREFTILELELFFDPEDPECPGLEEVCEEEIKILTEKMESEEVKEPLNITIGEAVKRGLILTEWQGYFMGVSKKFITHLGVKPENQRFRAHLPEERAHYSAQTFDHEVKLDTWGWIEVAGHAYRTDYDLKAHQDGSGEDMTALRQDVSRFIPHVVEPSFGLSRLIYVTMEANYRRQKKRNIFSFPRELSPYQVSIFPLVTKDGIPEKTRRVEGYLRKEDLLPYYDDSGSIGRRYARSDEIGTPLAITVDYDTLVKDVVTIRDRDSWEQITQKIEELPRVLREYFRRAADFEDLGEPLKR